jgi:hypothetical protein
MPFSHAWRTTRRDQAALFIFRSREMQLRLEARTGRERQQHIHAEVLPGALQQGRYSRLGHAQTLRCFDLRVTLLLKLFAQSHHELHAQRHHARLGFIESEIDEGIAAACDRTRVIQTAIGLLLGVTSGALHGFAGGVGLSTINC